MGGRKRGQNREPVSLLRVISGQAILVMSGPSREIYQNLKAKPEGTIVSQRTKPQATDRTPNDAASMIRSG
jgi:hypothetical protein